jgi:hypothetical protein
MLKTNKGKGITANLNAETMRCQKSQSLPNPRPWPFKGRKPEKRAANQITKTGRQEDDESANAASAS